ncbi:hypothetical protein GCM10010885_21490 [Alicyclobacillus cellulosilyticus]|uniref:histidine kinase n=1 Tax=Alicyclobacillus cellulosilyticus TaxID=1003997 RepID=A0A917KG33_9BACL|nr:ATP-binding protein [Alicyclobacillus cellulosilyticus]GGJ11856.1 hypothetical protein GCM10010885_21490 [Alicyclobacillus cellulosilyticus]
MRHHACTLPRYEERSVREQLATLTLLFNSIHDGCYEVDWTGRFRYFNPSLCDILGYSPEELQQSTIRQVLGRRAYVAAMRDLERQYRWDDPIKAYGLTFQRRDGKVLDLEISRTVVRGEGGVPVGFCGIVRNITYRKRAEAFMQQAEKLAVVGQLAAGIAHEIRNPLTTLKGFVQLLRVARPVKPEHLEIMDAELRRIERIVQEFLLLARPQPAVWQTHDLAQVLDDVIALLDTQALMRNVRICRDYSPVPQVVCDVHRLKQVFIHILQNALEASAAGGMVHVVLQPRHEGVVVRIVDQGAGMSPERLARLGEPFYTTKEKGTGLGLMVSRRIVEAHRGHLCIASEEGRGTTVEVILPATGPWTARWTERTRNEGETQTELTRTR